MRATSTQSNEGKLLYKHFSAAVGSHSSRHTIVQCTILFCRRVLYASRPTDIITLLNVFVVSIDITVSFPLLLVPNTTAMATLIPFRYAEHYRVEHVDDGEVSPG